MSIHTAVTDYLNKRDEAAQWADARFTEDAARAERDRIAAPAREALEAHIGLVRRDAAKDQSAYADAVAHALSDSSDNNRVLARELAWQRLLRRVERGETVEALAREASPVELEALVAFAPTELPHVKGNRNLDKSPREWRAYVEEVVVDAYAGHPDNQERFAPLAEKAANAKADLALADLGSALIAERPLDGNLRNRVYTLDQALYSRVTA